jgi:hypothetical protein
VHRFGDGAHLSQTVEEPNSTLKGRRFESHSRTLLTPTETPDASK